MQTTVLANMTTWSYASKASTFPDLTLTLTLTQTLTTCFNLLHSAQNRHLTAAHSIIVVFPWIGCTVSDRWCVVLEHSLTVHDPFVWAVLAHLSADETVAAILRQDSDP